MSRLIAICGGIGAGKSVVSRILRAWGYTVYDTDTEAKRIMDGDTDIHAAIADHICSDVIVDGAIDRQRLAQEVFSDSAKLATLNEIVHTAVINEMLSRLKSEDGCITFVECAIPRSSGLIEYVDAVWLVDAPRDIRIERVVRRNGISPQQVGARIDAQQLDETPDTSKPYTVIYNDGAHALLPQIYSALNTEHPHPAR